MRWPERRRSQPKSPSHSKRTLPVAPAAATSASYPDRVTNIELWLDFGSRLTDNRTSLIVHPPDGKIPARTPAGELRLETLAWFGRPADGPEDRTVSERCLTADQVPVTPFPAFNYLQLFQTPDHVAIVQEFAHEARLVPLDARPPLPARVRQWLGDSRGHWEGDTLVVETANFSDRTSFQGSGSRMQLVERFTRIDAATLRYEYTVTDPESFVSPWSARLSMTLSDAPIYETACHEGNYSMSLILSGARVREREEAASR